MMRSFTILLLVTLFAFAFAEVETPQQQESVYVLNEENFVWIHDQDHVLVEFYAPWCGHCKSLAPVYAEVATRLGNEESPIKLAMVDATENQELAQALQIEGFPTLLWFSKENEHRPLNYDGPRDIEGMYKWVTKQIATELDSADSLSSIEVGDNEGYVVLFGEASGDLGNDLLGFSKVISDLGFFRITDEAQFGDYKNGDIVTFPKGGNPIVSEATTQEELFSFVLKNSYAPVVEFNQAHFQRLAERNFVIIGVDNFEDDEKKNALFDTFKAVAEDQDNFGFMVGDSNMLMRGIQGAGASGDVLPTAVALNMKGQAQLPWNEDDEFNAENLKKWMSDLLEGTAKVFKKSEPIPEDDGSENVRTLVAKNFDDVVNENNNVLVEYYAPWCGHCKSLAPIYEEVATHFKNEGSDVIIAKIDATANYIEANVEGFPTLIWYGKDGSSEPFEESRTADDLIIFINQKLAPVDQHDEL